MAVLKMTQRTRLAKSQLVVPVNSPNVQRCSLQLLGRLASITRNGMQPQLEELTGMGRS